MTEITPKDLQTKYRYTWTRDDGDELYQGKRDRERVDKDEGYEVLYFIRSLMKEHGLGMEYVHKIEEALHSDDLSDVVMRSELIDEIEDKLEL